MNVVKLPEHTIHALYEQYRLPQVTEVSCLIPDESPYFTAFNLEDEATWAMLKRAYQHLAQWLAVRVQAEPQYVLGKALYLTRADYTLGAMLAGVSGEDCPTELREAVQAWQQWLMQAFNDALDKQSISMNRGILWDLTQHAYRVYIEHRRAFIVACLAALGVHPLVANRLDLIDAELDWYDRRAPHDAKLDVDYPNQRTSRFYSVMYQRYMTVAQDSLLAPLYLAQEVKRDE